jgi:hypothetical protein
MKAGLYATIVFLYFHSIVLGGGPHSIATEIVQKAKSECDSFEGGKFNATEQAITLHDFTGDGRPEEVVDASQFSCSTGGVIVGWLRWNIFMGDCRWKSIRISCA